MKDRLQTWAPDRPFWTLLHFSRPYWRSYIVGIVLALLFSPVAVAMPLVIDAAFDRFQAGTMTGGRLWFYFGLLIAIAGVTGVARYFQRMLMIGASRRIEYDLRNAYFAHVQTLAQDFFHRKSTGDIMARATNDMNYVRMVLGPGVMYGIDLIILPYALAVMIHKSPLLTAFALVPLPLLTILVYLFVTYMHRQSKVVQEQFGVVNSRVQEDLSGARVVKAYGIEERELRSFREESTRYMRENMRLYGVQALGQPIIGLVGGLMVLFILWRGGLMVIGGRIDVGDFTAFILVLLMMMWPLESLGWILTLYQRGSVGMRRILEIMSETPSIRDGESTRDDIRTLNGAIAFENVTFGYGDEPVLHDVSFRIEAGQTVAVVGPTGAGKSSIVGLITREYDPTSGHVTVDGVDARHIPVRVLRGAIGYVPQDTFLFSDSVRNNLTLGRPDATDAEIMAAAEAAQFAETLERLPQGLATLLGERGINLSGGQKQRLAIARAILRDPPILILDDALSSVDTHTEEEILRHLKEVAATRTTLIISHRISSICHADNILVLDDGRLVEQGTHDELVAAGGLYADLYQRQLLEEELEETA